MEASFGFPSILLAGLFVSCHLVCPKLRKLSPFSDGEDITATTSPIHVAKKKRIIHLERAAGVKFNSNPAG